jgi:hypothetical protein
MNDPSLPSFAQHPGPSTNLKGTTVTVTVMGYQAWSSPNNSQTHFKAAASMPAKSINDTDVSQLLPCATVAAVAPTRRRLAAIPIPLQLTPPGR